MNGKTKLGLVLTLLGIVSLVLSIVKFESRQEVFRMGDFQATATTEKTFPVFSVCGRRLCGCRVCSSVRRHPGKATKVEVGLVFSCAPFLAGYDNAHVRCV